jgi:hypothetical protein
VIVVLKNWIEGYFQDFEDKELSSLLLRFIDNIIAPEMPAAAKQLRVTYERKVRPASPPCTALLLLHSFIKCPNLNVSSFSQLSNEAVDAGGALVACPSPILPRVAPGAALSFMDIDTQEVRNNRSGCLPYPQLTRLFSVLAGPANDSLRSKTFFPDLAQRMPQQELEQRRRICSTHQRAFSAVQ